MPLDSICIVCKEVLSDVEVSITCCECDSFYHLGACSGVTAVAFKSKNASAWKSWQCSTCQRVKQRGGPSGRKGEVVDMPTLLVTINAKLDSLMSLKETVTGIETSMQMLSDKYDKILEHINHQDNETKAVKKRLEALERLKTGEEIEQLKRDLSDMEWRSRRPNLEIYGIPVAKEENLLVRVNEIGARLNLPELTDGDIVNIHRLPAKQDRNPGVIVRFAQQTTRDRWLDKKGELRRSRSNVFFQENLTRQSKALLWAAKEWAKRNNYQYVWHRNDKVFIRKQDGERALKISDAADLDRIL